MGKGDIRMILNQIKNRLFLNILMIFFILLEYISFLYVEEFYLRFIEAQLILIFLYFFISTFQLTKNWLNLYTIFLVLTFLFLLSRPFMHLFNLVDVVNYDESHWFRIRKDFHFSSFTMIKINFILIFTLLFLNMGYLLGYKKYFNIKNKTLKFSKIFNKKIAYVLFTLGMTAFLVKVILYIQLLNTYGYVYLFSGKYTLPLLIRILDDFFYIGYIMILVHIPSKREGYILSIIFILLYATSLLTGMRGEFFVSFFSVIWLLSTVYQWKIKLYRIMLSGLTLIVLAQSILMVKYKYINYDDINFFDFLNLFIFSQGVSVLLIGYLIEFKSMFVDIYSGFRYLISPFVNMFLTLTGQQVPREVSDPNTIHSISHKLEFFLNPDGYYAGSGIGSSYIAELYGLGGDIFFIAIGAFFIGFFIIFLEKKLIYKKYGLFIIMMILPILFWLPRSSIANLFNRYIFIMILIIFLLFIYNLLSTRKRENI